MQLHSDRKTSTVSVWAELTSLLQYCCFKKKKKHPAYLQDMSALIESSTVIEIGHRREKESTNKNTSIPFSVQQVLMSMPASQRLIPLTATQKSILSLAVSHLIIKAVHEESHASYGSWIHRGFECVLISRGVWYHKASLLVDSYSWLDKSYFHPKTA